MSGQEGQPPQLQPDQQPDGNGLDGAPLVVPNVPIVNTKAIPSTFKLPKGHEALVGASNWDTWAFRLQNVFEAEDAWDIVNGTEPQPTDSAQRVIWKAKNKAARITINLAIADSCVPLVLGLELASDAWKALSDAYKTKGLMTAFHVRGQILSFKFNESLPFCPQIDHL